MASYRIAPADRGTKITFKVKDDEELYELVCSKPDFIVEAVFRRDVGDSTWHMIGYHQIPAEIRSSIQAQLFTLKDFCNAN